MTRVAAFNHYNNTDDEKLKASIRNASAAAKGRVTRNPPTQGFAKKTESTNFYTAADYDSEYRKILEA